MRNMLNPRRFSRVWNAGQQGLVVADATAVMLADRQFELFGTNVVDGAVTYVDDHGLLLTTQGAGLDQVILFPSDAGDNRSVFREYNWGPENETSFETVIRTGAFANVVSWWAGLALTTPATIVVGDDNDEIQFLAVQGTDTTWQCATSVGGTDTISDSGIACEATTVYHLAIRFDKERRPHFFINEMEVAVGPVCTAGTAVLPRVAIEEGSAAGKLMHVRSIAMARNWGVN
ncbi:hypothetical protein LCGC14_0548980 [marine sediment metagenome]|uniref:Uncharacterized protein n=1 Tax=marine sediment metagenome TaxID=412755 RepID=A0A0F9RQG5_9ZZZZ